MLTKIVGKWAIVIAAIVLVWPASASWAGDRSLEVMRAKDYMILESMRLRHYASEPILAAMETAEAIPEDELGDFRGGFDTFFFLNISGSIGGEKWFPFGKLIGEEGDSGVGLVDEEAQSLTVVGDLNGGCCFFQINQATGDGNTFTNVMSIDVAMVTVTDTAQLASVVTALRDIFR
jgi:hypothetical protein